MSEQNPPVGKLILWPAVITLAVTLLRLAGELLHWSPALFSREAGGGGSLVGISWLPPVFGILFGVQLVRLGYGPATGGRAVGRALLGLLAAVAVMFGAGAAGLMKPGQFSVVSLLVFTIAVAVGAAVAWTGWPALGRTMLAYALAARVPVAVVMLVAMIGNWQTHYDVAPPNAELARMGVLQKWLMIGAFPQFTVWIAITILLGAVAGGIAGAVALRGRASAAQRAA